MSTSPCLFIAVALSLGTAIAEYTRITEGAFAMMAAAGLVASVWARYRGYGTVVMVGVCLVACAAWRAHTSACLPWPDAASQRAQGCGPLPAQLVRMRLVGPVRRTMKNQSAPRQQARAQVLEVARDGVWQPYAGEVLLHLWPDPKVATGDVVVVPAHLSGPPKPTNMGDAEAATWSHHRGLSGRAEVVGAHVVVDIGPRALRAFDMWRQRCVAHLDEALAPPSAALARAMALGDNTALSDDVRDRWAKAGMAHLLCVSGLHVALVMGAVSWTLLMACRCAPRLQERWPVASYQKHLMLLAGLGFAALSGGGWACMRAVLMAWVVVWGQLLGRRPTSLQALCAAGAALVWLWPRALFDVGFILSFAAVSGLIVWSPNGRRRTRAQDALQQPIVWRLTRHLGRRACTAWRLCCVAQLATAPVCAFVFGRVAGTASVVNLIAVPTASAATALSLAGAVLGPCAGAWCLELCAVTMSWLDAMARIACRMPCASVWAPGHDVCWQLSMACLCVSLSVAHRGAAKATRVCGQRMTCGCVALALATYAWAWAASPGTGALQVDHVYVGQGDATFVTLPEGLTLLVDGGGATGAGHPDPGRVQVGPSLGRRGIRRIDVMVLTHPHPDHIGGLVHVARHFEVGALWLNGDGLHHTDVQTLIALVRAQGGRVGPPPNSWYVQGVKLTSMQPLAGTWASANDHSLVLRLQLGRRSILLAGDIEGRAETMLASGLGPTDLLKAGHHGSKTSTSISLLEATRPLGVIISCGTDNQFGFPHEEVLARLKARDIAVWRMDTMGALHLETRGDTWHGAGPTGAVWRPLDRGAHGM